MRRARVSSEYIGRGRKGCRNELKKVEFGSSKARFMTPIAPSFSYRSMSVIGAPSAAASTSASTAAARVMTRRMVRELSLVKGFLEFKEEPAVVLLEEPEEVQVKVEVEEAMVSMVKEEPKESDEEEAVEEEEEEKSGVGAAEHEAEDGPEEGGVGCATAETREGVVGYSEEFEDGLIDWNAWSFELEERAWWGSWYWDWIWYPHSDYIHSGINWASYSVNNKGADWEVCLWNWE